MTETSRRAEVLRLLDRYLIEVVERYQLCPWARGARDGGELTVEVLWGTPMVAGWVATAERLLARPGARVVMVIAPELVISPPDLRSLRAEVAARIPTAGVAEFHPEAPLDLTTAGRLVPFVRRSPDPLLQLVPLTILDAVRPPSPTASRLHQAEMLLDRVAPPRLDAADRIARENHATVSASQVAIVATLDDIAADRRRSYARVGIDGAR